MIGALESPSPDPNDPATTTCTPPPGRDYTKFLKADGLKGARIGIPRAFYYDRLVLPGDESTPPAERRAEAVAAAPRLRSGRRGRPGARRSERGAGQASWPMRSPC